MCLWVSVLNLVGSRLSTQRVTSDEYLDGRRLSFFGVKRQQKLNYLAFKPAPISSLKNRLDLHCNRHTFAIFESKLHV